MGAGMTLAKHRLALNEPHLETAQSDDILTLDTDMRAPLKALRVGFEPVQEGEGDPSPENVRPITGWDGVTIDARGRNLFDLAYYADGISWSSSAGTVYGGYLEWLRDGTVRVTKTHEMITPTSIWGTAGYAIIRIGPKGYIVQNVGICNMLPIWMGTASSIPNGRFKVLNSDGYNRAQAIIKISGLSTVEDYNAWLQSLSDAGSPLQICYELATPVTYTLTPQEALRTLRGENNIWSDANGAISATYWTH